MKASTKLYSGTVLQFLVAISLVAVFLYMLEKQKHDSVVINLAGRQRMLSQKITKEILLFSQSGFPAEKVLNTIDMFDQTLKALTYGGTAPLDLVQHRNPGPLGQVRVQRLCHLYDSMLLNDQVVPATYDQGVTNEPIS